MLCYVNLVSKVQTFWERGWCYLKLSVYDCMTNDTNVSKCANQTGKSHYKKYIEAISFHSCSKLTTCRARDSTCLIRGYIHTSFLIPVFPFTRGRVAPRPQSSYFWRPQEAKASGWSREFLLMNTFWSRMLGQEWKLGLVVDYFEKLAFSKW